MRFLLFALAGIVLGFVLHALSRVRQARGPALIALVVRLLIFVIVVGWLARAYGPVPGLAVLVAAILTRALLARGRELGEHPRRGAESG